MKKTIGLVAILLAVLAGTAQAERLNIDFGSTNAVPSSVFGAASGQTGNWNQIVSLGLTSGLVDTTGSSTDVSLDLSALSITGNGGLIGTSDLMLLVDDNFYSHIGLGTPWSFVLSGLDTGLYDIYMYSNTNISVPTGPFTVNGIAVASFGIASGTSLVLGTDYRVVSGLSIAAGTLTFQSTSNAGYSGLSGIQVVTAEGNAVPEPGTIALAGLGLVGILMTARSRRRA